jgi:hypothetical protein
LLSGPDPVGAMAGFGSPGGFHAPIGASAGSGLVPGAAGFEPANPAGAMAEVVEVAASWLELPQDVKAAILAAIREARNQ